ncbi:sensor histidine kinase [Zoogloea sp.]|uniref:sensor histidine kinase n=1 Tax=Zoogloea sp. TaxID=49181 RepID=UPI0035B12869|nr:histidine kinase [Rhodocyclales bacterium]
MSIKQNLPPAGTLRRSLRLPDFRNLGVTLRTLLLANGLALLAVLVRNDEPAQLYPQILSMASHLEFPLLLALGTLALLQPLLARLPYGAGVAAILGTVHLLGLVWQQLVPLLEEQAPWRPLVWSQVMTLAVLGYFHLRGTRQLPALAEARMLALTARIRPHFLFNSLNGVLGIIREDPRRAERALEELSDLFRALMKDNRELVPLADEIALCERYLNLEQLRLGERLRVAWSVAPGSTACLVPPLMLQPLIENAVCHGVEPGAGLGLVSITISRQGPQILLEIVNPLPERLQPESTGNRMAVDNIRERLMLFFDLEATLETRQTDALYCVRIRLPYRSRP